MQKRERCGVVIAEHCNLSCTSCNHLSPILGKKFMDPAVFEKQAKILAKRIHFKYLTFQGGEPLLHPDVNRFLRIGIESGLADEMHVLTNATYLHKMDEEFWKLVSKVRVSAYPGVKIEPISEEHSKKVRWVDFNTFTETFSSVRNEDHELVMRIKETCELFDRCFSLSGDYLHKCIVGCFIPYGAAHEILTPVTVDGILVDDRETFGRELDEYLDDKAPLRACEFCVGSKGKRFPHTMTPRKQWLERHHTPIQDQLDPVFYGKFLKGL